MSEKFEYTELVGSNVGFDLESEQLTLQFNMSVNGNVRFGRPWRLSRIGAEQLIFQLREALDRLNPSTPN